MSDAAYTVLQEQTMDDVLNMPLTKVFSEIDQRGYDELYERLTSVFVDIVEAIMEERMK